jgi:uridine monophosphate synthetase
MAEIIRDRNLLPANANLIAPIASGIPIGAALALQLNVPFVMDRGKPKAHGKGQRFEGVFSDDPRCLIIDDLITAGSTLKQTISGLQELGKQVTDVIVVVDREEGGAEALQPFGVKLHHLVTKAELQASIERPATLRAASS